MADVLIVYATVLGHTRRIAERVASELRALGHAPTVAACDAAPPMGDFAAVIVGAPVRSAAFLAPIDAYVRANAADLARRPSALYAVCSPDEHDDRTYRQAIDGYLRALQSATGWQPDVIASFAGVRTHPHLGLAAQVLGHEALGEAATDWDAVSGFVEAIVHHLDRSASGPNGLSSTRPASA